MRQSPGILLLLLLAFSLLSCQKELSFEKDSGNNPASLLGDWKFIELSVAVESGSTFDNYGVPGRMVATYTDTTQNNTGILTVTTDKMKTTDFGYTLTAEVKMVIYLGGNPVDQPLYEQLDFVMPPRNAGSDYQQVGSDSLYFPNGSIFDIPGTNGQQLPGASDPTGARFTINGDTLIIKSAENRSAIVKQGNDELEVTEKVNKAATFLRQ